MNHDKLYYQLLAKDLEIDLAGARQKIIYLEGENAALRTIINHRTNELARIANQVDSLVQQARELAQAADRGFRDPESSPDIYVPSDLSWTEESGVSDEADSQSSEADYSAPQRDGSGDPGTR